MNHFTIEDAKRGDSIKRGRTTHGISRVEQRTTRTGHIQAYVVTYDDFTGDEVFPPGSRLTGWQATVQCNWGQSGSYQSACDMDAVGGSEYCTLHAALSVAQE